MNIKAVNIKTVFLGSGLLTAGLGYLILFGRSSTQALEGSILFMIGTLLLSVVGMMEAISLSQKETRELLEKLLKESPPSKPPTSSQPTPISS